MLVPESAFERAKLGSGQLVAVNRPPGAERTQYLVQAVEQAQAQGLAVVWTTCRADAPAYWPWHAVLAGLGGDAAALDAGPEVCARKVVDVLRRTPALILMDDVDVAGEEAFQLTRLVAGTVHQLPVVIVVTSTGTTALDDAVRLVERAHAVLARGRITEARDLLDQAARDGDPEAALGLPGMWVNKFRGRADRALALARLREAVAAQPPEPLRTRLVTRLAAEQAYDRRETECVLEALEQARNTGDQLTLAEALSLAHHALWSPEHTAFRLALADELISVASAAGLDLLALSGLCRRTMDLFCLGDPHAERSQVELARRASGYPGLLFFHAAIDVMRTIRAGRFAEAEQKSLACLRLGLEAGDVDAETFHSTHLFAIRWLQGRGGELVDLAEQVTHSPTLPDLEFSFEAALALLALEAGQRDRARSALHRLTINGLTAVPLSSTWITCLFCVVHVAAALGEADIAREAYRLLGPFAPLPVVPATAIVCFGSTELLLGIAATTFGEPALATGHLERAVTTNIRLGNLPMTAYARATLAQTVGGERGRALFDVAIRDANVIGMTARAAMWAQARDGLSGRIVIRKENAWWIVSHQGRETRVEDLVGMRYLARLVADPGVEIAALELVGGQDSGNQPVLDPVARAAYLTRIRDLRAQLDDNPTPRAEAELEALLSHLERETGMGGRGRNFAGPAERARTAVRKAIRRAIDTIAATEQPTADALRKAVTTGYHCSYQPD
ncbi:hypothetical protein SK854_10620 [Lentzea sp. BCCO 10_0061]|uniref:Uncharacterized protein n=1 Tax=Lentzea sokolovensis TaxID=3095429 RepID=A0ABU4USV6_9PSEU|nr:hypothetical protein [Lentzea sp. BCCO 10_0061]MDX8142570.1 hypothetical protein [Lentzea sp. BCCO 10_0061]